jgi:FKBP-type peptidyl-prolyl cis-trans isomerase
MKNFLLVPFVLVFGCAQQSSSVGSNEYITTPSGLQYKIIQPGTGEAAKEGDEILLFETMSYRDGTVIFSNENTDSPVQVLIGGNQAVQAVDEGLRGMQVGEIRELIATPNLVKRQVYPNNLSQDSTLVFRLILHDIL